ncbi:MAG: hypothetical protein IRZ26_06320 [Clostridia bacterium]|nr:hypothetical protein [Clostridia bacterium]MCL6521834.1 hypothetical protein [Bacillota bacterium]
MTRLDVRDLVDWAFDRLTRARRVYDAEGRPTIYLPALTRYRGPEVRDERGEVVLRDGQPAIEVHLDNRWLRQAGADGPVDPQATFALLRMARRQMRALADYLAGPEVPPQYAVCFGRSLFGAFTGRLGWHEAELPPGQSRLLGWYEDWLRRPRRAGAGRSPAAAGRRRATLVWIGRRELVERYGGRAAGSDRPATGESPAGGD